MRSDTAAIPARRFLADVFVPTAFVLALLASPAALAEQSSVSGSKAVRASASIDFRIVIPETVRFVQGQEQRDRTRQHTSRTVDVIDGQRIVTIARP